MSEKYKKTPAQIILSHLIHRGVSVIPKSNSRDRIAENFDCLFEMEEEDNKVLENLVGMNGERGVRNLETKEYLGFDNYSEDCEEPWTSNLELAVLYDFAYHYGPMGFLTH